jgi:hypothetical protein
LFRAAEQIEHAVAGARPDATWARQARAAIRAGTLAVERRLNDLVGPEGYGEDIALEEPRLLPELEHLEESLARLLVESWSAKPAGSELTPELLRRLAELAAEMRRVASAEFALVHESLIKPTGLD